MIMTACVPNWECYSHFKAGLHYMCSQACDNFPYTPAVSILDINREPISNFHRILCEANTASYRHQLGPHIFREIYSQSEGICHDCGSRVKMRLAPHTIFCC